MNIKIYLSLKFLFANILFLLLFIFTLKANNVKIDSAPIITGTDVNNDYTNIQFDMSWDNSWRNATNWDAVWVFVKYKVGTGNWQHAYLSTNATHHNVNLNNGVAPSFAVGTTNVSGSDRGIGVFIYRDANGTGNINWDQTNLRWNYGENGVPDNAQITVKVFAIEMVYVPQSAFYVGDGTTVVADIKGHFHNADNNANPFQITSEASLTLGGVVAGNLGNNNTIGMNGSYLDDFNNTTTQILPAAFPKGYNAFYCMKYEISQEQYVEFLNTLTRTQQANRVATSVAVGVTAITNRYVMSNTAALTNRNSIRCDGTIDANNSITFYCDFNGNGTSTNGLANEIGDGMNIACGYIKYSDDVAYSDWAGLRPLTELEYEKTNRGTNIPIIGEAAWGSTTLNVLTGINNSGFENEIASNTPSNCNVNNGYPTGPIRCGMFATATSTREESGGSFYGIMELSGNIYEIIIGVGTSNGRAFDGLHGNGEVDVSGNADVTNWPTIISNGLKGGAYNNTAGSIGFCISTRINVNFANIARNSTRGFRCCRTAL